MLGQILQMSQTMLALAEQDEWEQVEVLQRDRQQLMEQALPLDPALTNPDSAAAQIKEILGLDQQITELARSQQKEIGQVLGKLNQGRAATRAYQGNSRG